MAIPTLATIKSSNSEQMTKIYSFAPTVGAIAISLIVLIFVVWPKISQMFRIQADNRIQADKLVILDEKLRKLEVKSADIETMEANLAAADALIPSDKGVFTLIAQLEKAAAASGVLLNRVDIAPGPIEGDGLSTTTSSSAAVSQQPVVAAQSGTVDSFGLAPRVQVKLSLTSDYKSFLQFLNNSLAISRVVAIQDLSVASASESSSQVRAAMVVNAFWKPLPRELSSIETPIEELTGEESARLSQVSETGLSGVAPIGPVTLGRSDLFAPF